MILALNVFVLLSLPRSQGRLNVHCHGQKFPNLPPLPRRARRQLRPPPRPWPRPPAKVAFEIENFSLWYGARQALYDVSIQIPAKGVTAIIGPSGCGKSTFLRALNRMHELTPGTRIAGPPPARRAGSLFRKDVDPTVVRRRVGMVFQKSNPFPTMTISENVLVGLRLNGVTDRTFLRQRLEESLRMAALWDEVKDSLSQPGISLSGGQQQRLCIARRAGGATGRWC